MKKLKIVINHFIESKYMIYIIFVLFALEIGLLTEGVRSELLEKGLYILLIGHCYHGIKVILQDYIFNKWVYSVLSLLCSVIFVRILIEVIVVAI